MKNKLLITSLLFAAAGALSAEDLSVNQSALEASTWSWNDISNWSGGTTLDGSNLTIKGTLSAANTGTIDSALTAGTLTYDIDSTFQSTTTLGGATTFDSIVFQNGNILLSSQNAHALTVKGDLIVNSLQNVVIKNEGVKATFKNIYVNNDKSKGAFTIWGTSSMNVLTMKAAAGADGAKVELYTYGQSVSGLSDGGVQANHVLKTNWQGYITFYNWGQYDWSGELQADRLQISMQGGGNGYQRLNLTKFSSGTWANDGDPYKGQKGLKVEVVSGRLILNESSTKHCLLNLKGGVFETEGRIEFIDGTFTGGDIKIANKDTYIAFDKATKTDGLKIGLDFSAITEADEYFILAIGDTESSDGFDFANAENDFEIKGLSESLKGSLAWNGGTLVATITAAVPEPATVAAILGAIALGFAAYRRRK